MGPSAKAVCLLVLGLYILFQLVDTFYFNLGDNDRDEQSPKQFFGPFIGIEGPIRIDSGNEREDEMNSSHENDIAELLSTVPNKTKENGYQIGLPGPGLGCNAVHEERYRCCRVYDQVVEAWWCPVRRPFCCHQGTSCAVCCSPDELRLVEDSLTPTGCRQSRPRPPGVRQQQQQPPEPTTVDDNWFWNGMKAAWLTMFVVLVGSVCCTCLIYRCITYIVTIVNEEDTDLEGEYLAYHFDSLGLVGSEDHQTSRQPASRALPPPKYSDINFIPVQPEAPVTTPAPGEPPPHYTSEPEPELETETEMERETETETETTRPPSAPPLTNQI